MLIALAQSPITAQQFVEWDEKLQSDEILVREIIDIDTNYMEDENTGPSAKQRNSGETDKNDENNGEDDEFNPTLASVGLNSSSSPLFSSFLSVSPEFRCLALGPVFSSSM